MCARLVSEESSHLQVKLFVPPPRRAGGAQEASSSRLTPAVLRASRKASPIGLRSERRGNKGCQRSCYVNSDPGEGERPLVGLEGRCLRTRADLNRSILLGTVGVHTQSSHRSFCERRDWDWLLSSVSHTHTPTGRTPSSFCVNICRLLTSTLCEPRGSKAARTLAPPISPVAWRADSHWGA